MREKLIIVLENSILDYTGDSNIIVKFISKISTHSLYTFLTHESLEGIMNYIYSNDQDNILDFIQLVNHNLIISDIDINNIINSITQHICLYNVKIVNDELIKLLKVDINIVNKYNTITILYLLKIYSKNILKILYKHKNNSN